MNSITSLRKILNEINENRIDYLFLFYQLIYFSRNIRQFADHNYVAVHLIITILFCIWQKKMIITNVFIIITIFYFIICLIPIVAFGFSITYLAFYARFIVGYFIVIYFRKNLIQYFVNIVFVLALISIPFFFISVLYPSFFDIFSGFSNAILAEETITSFTAKTFRHRYILVYLFNSYGYTRNSGFMSEPSAFGAVLAWAMLFNLYTTNFKGGMVFNVLFLVAITTFSIGTYVYMSLISILFLINNIRIKKIKVILRSLPFLLLAILYFTINPLFNRNYKEIQYKIDYEPTNISNVQRGIADRSDVSRTAGAIVNIKYFISFPFGYGFIDKDNIKYNEYKYLGDSPNGLSVLIVRWGLWFIIFICVGSYRMTQILAFNFKKMSYISIIITMSILILPISGYSFHNQPFLWAFLFYPFIMYSSYYKSHRFASTSTFSLNNKYPNR